MDVEILITLGLGPAFVMAYALAAKVAISVMQSATEVKLTETIPNACK